MLESLQRKKIKESIKFIIKNATKSQSGFVAFFYIKGGKLNERDKKYYF